MKKILLLIAFLFWVLIPGKSQKTSGTGNIPNDTAQYPYWVHMMQDPSVNFFKVQRAFNIYWQNRKITKGCGWKVFKRWEYMMQSRVLPNGDRPAPELAEHAFEQYLRTRTTNNGNWVSLGPGYIPLPGPGGYEGLGRINTVGFHPTDPNKIFIGAPSGGMWQSTDGGVTWVTHTDTLPTLGVSSIIVDYSNPNRIFIGTGDRDAGDAPGLGVYKSIDGGLTWSPSKTGMGNQTVGRMIQDPLNSSIILAATTSGIYRTTDAGNNWSLIISGVFKDIAFKPTDHTIVYATGNADFFRSTNNGVSFTQISAGLGSGQRGTLAVTASNPAYVYLLFGANDNGYGGIYRSTDSGLTFTLRSSTPNILDWSCDGSGTGGQGWYDLALAADPTNSNTVFVGGVDVWKSTDGGVTWAINSHWYGGCSVPAVHADCHFLGYSPVSGQLYAGDDGGVWSTGDGGTTWNDHTVGITIGQIYKIGQAQLSKNHVINGFQDNGSYTLSPSGWIATGGGDGMECAIDYSDDAYSYYTIYYGDIYRRYNNANENHVAGNGTNGIDESGAWVTPFILHATNPNTMFAGYVNVWRCTNIKDNTPVWQKISDGWGNNVAVLEQSPANINILYAARYDNRLYRTDNCMDANPNWTELTGSLPVAATPTDLACHPSDPNTVYMTIANGIYKSTDRGVTWTNISGSLPAVHMNTVAYYKNDLEGLYVGTDAGVYYKSSSMPDWLFYSHGLPANARITELEIYYDNDSVSSDVIRGSSYGRGLWGSPLYHTGPVTDFTANKTSISAGCSINFTDLSSGVPTFWQWTFTGGTPSTSAVKNPAGITYNTPGTYSVKMKAWNEFGTDSITKTNYITVGNAQAPATDFTADRTVICVGDHVQFQDESDNCPTTWYWEFAPASVTFLNGSNANSQNPLVQFNDATLYTVRLTAYNGNGSNSNTKVNYIASGGYLLPFTEDFEQGLGAQSWTIMNPDAGITWDTITTAGTSPGTLSAWINFYNYGKSSARDQLISPALNFSSLSTVGLSFSHAYAERASLRDSLIVKISTDCGTTWTRLMAAGPNETPNVFATHVPMFDSFVPQSAYDWCGSAYGTACYSLDLSSYAGLKNIKIMFETYNRHGNNLYLDNISISGNVGIQDQGANGQRITIYPNPSEGLFNLIISKPSQTVDLSVVNTQGKTVYTDHFQAKTENTVKPLNLSGLVRGVYLVRIVTDQSSFIEKIIIN